MQMKTKQLKRSTITTAKVLIMKTNRIKKVNHHGKIITVGVKNDWSPPKDAKSKQLIQVLNQLMLAS